MEWVGGDEWDGIWVVNWGWGEGKDWEEIDLNEVWGGVGGKWGKGCM